MKKTISIIALSLSVTISAYGAQSSQSDNSDKTISLSVEDVQMVTNAQKQVAIVLNNPFKKLTAFQLDLVIPEGVSIAVDEATLNPSRVEDHELHVAQVGDNTYRFLAFSKTNADFIGTEGDLIYVPLVSGEDVYDEAMTASIGSPLVCASDGTNNNLASVSFTVQVNGEQSITFGASGFLTCVSKFNLDFSSLDKVKAYIATGYDLTDNELWLTRVNDVPAGTPIWVSGPVDETVKVPGAPSISYYPENLLVGNATASTEVPAGIDDYQNWILDKDGKLSKITSDMTLEAGKAYLHLPKTVASNVTRSSLPITLPAAGLLTYVGKYDLDFSDVEGLKAYIVTGFAKGGNIWLTPVKKASAGTSLYLVGENNAEYMVPSKEVKIAVANMLKGSATSSTDLTTLDESLAPCILNLGKDKFEPMSALVLSILNPLSAGTVYMPVLTDYVFNPATQKAYNTFVSEAEVISIKLESMMTAINSVKASRKDEGVWYNLQGQRVDNPRKGLYILDGKKTVVK